jgi:hypothetical protein
MDQLSSDTGHSSPPTTPTSKKKSLKNMTSTPIAISSDDKRNEIKKSESNLSIDIESELDNSHNSLIQQHSHLQSTNSYVNTTQLMQSGGTNNPLNEKVATLASSIYTELETIVKLYGRDTVKNLMSIVVNVLEALDSAYQEKEEQIVENELLKDDYEKLLNQYEKEKQSRKDTELKLFQIEDSFAEQKKDYDEKVKSLESIVRMIDLKSKNSSDHVVRLEEKEVELRREYDLLHKRYTEVNKNLFLF